MEADITNALASILSSDQMKTYKITSEISYLQNSLIEKSLYNRFKGNLSEKDDFVKKNIKRIGLRSYTFKDENYIKTAVVK
ncbi:hypothetical protein D3C86_1706450 [compost metagenome]